MKKQDSGTSHTSTCIKCKYCKKSKMDTFKLQFNKIQYLLHSKMLSQRGERLMCKIIYKSFLIIGVAVKLFWDIILKLSIPCNVYISVHLLLYVYI